MTAPAHRTAQCAGFAAVTTVTGLIWRLAPLHLPPFLLKYGGSVLWAVMVYWLFAAALPNLDAVKVGIFACIFALGIECLRLVNTPGLDEFRLTLAGKLLLGRYFSLADIGAYWIAIFATAFLDRRLLSTPRRGN